MLADSTAAQTVCMWHRHSCLCGFSLFQDQTQTNIPQDKFVLDELLSGLGVGLWQHRQECLCHKCSEKPVGARAEEFEKVHVPEDLGLVADFSGKSLASSLSRVVD